MAFFREFEGPRIPVEWTSPEPGIQRGLFAIGCRNESELLILLHNATPRPVEVDVRGLANWPDGVRVARMRWEGAIPADHRSPTPAGSSWRFDESAKESLTKPSLRLEAEETAILRIPHAAPPIRQVVIQRIHAPEFLQDLADGANLTFDLADGDLESAIGARLVVGLSSPRGVEGGQIRVAWPGERGPSFAPVGIGEGWRQAVVPVSVDVPVAELRAGRWSARIDDVDRAWPPGARIVSARLEIRNELPVGRGPRKEP